MTETVETAAIKRRIDALDRVIIDARFASVNADDKKKLKVVCKAVRYDIKSARKSTFSLPVEGGAETDAFRTKLLELLSEIKKARASAFVGCKTRLDDFISEAESEKIKLEAVFAAQKAGEFLNKAKDGAAAGIKKISNAIASGIEKLKG